MATAIRGQRDASIHANGMTGSGFETTEREKDPMLCVHQSMKKGLVGKVRY